MKRLAKPVLIGAFLMAALTGTVANYFQPTGHEVSGLPEEAQVGLIAEGYWNLKARISDDQESQFRLGVIELYRNLDKEKAATWFNKAACAGSIRAKEYLRAIDRAPTCT